MSAITKTLGVSPGTLHGHIPDPHGLRAGRIPAPLEGISR
ncbi:hypothetical protein M2169_006191 [Streptomyces sp. MJP52]|nr:hypothetical protein [Streptomyces sp. MJP52]